MNSAMPADKLNHTMMEFARQNDIAETKQELMDDILDDDADEEEVDEEMQKVRRKRKRVTEAGVGLDRTRHQRADVKGESWHVCTFAEHER